MHASMIGTSRVLLAICIVIGPLGAAVSLAQKIDNDTELHLRAAESHLSAFKNVQAWMEIEEGVAVSAADAKAGRFAPEPRSVNAKVFWATDGSRTRYDKIYDPSDMKRFERKQGNRTIGRYQSHTAILNDAIEIGDGPYQGVQVARRNTFSYVGPHPLNLGMGSPFPIRARSILSEAGSAKIVDKTRIGEGEYLTIELHMPFHENQIQIDRYVIDPERGYSVLRVETLFNNDKNAAHLFEVVDLRDFGAGRWLPTHFRFMSLQDKPIALWEVRVQKVELDQPLPEDTFVLTVTPGTKGYNRFNDSRFLCKTGKVPLTAFRSDGTILPNPNIEISTPTSESNVATSKSAKVDRPPATSEVAQWPFGPQPEDSTTRWWLAALAAVLAIAAIVIWRLKKK